MQVLDLEVLTEARRLVAGILAHRDRRGEWPFSPTINQMSAYKQAKNKTGMAEHAKRAGWLETVEHGSNATNGKPRVEYQATDRARAALALPEPLPPRTHDEDGKLISYPADEAELAICAYLDTFWRKYGRWPTGAERRPVFSGSAALHISKYRHAMAYESLLANGTLVEIKVRTPWLSREASCYVIVNKSPEFADKHGMLFYHADSIPT